MTLILKPHNKRKIWYIYAQHNIVPNSAPRVRNKNQAKSLELSLIFFNLKGNELSRVRRNRKNGHSTEHCVELGEEAGVTRTERCMWINGVETATGDVWWDFRGDRETRSPRIQPNEFIHIFEFAPISSYPHPKVTDKDINHNTQFSKLRLRED